MLASFTLFSTLTLMAPFTMYLIWIQKSILLIWSFSPLLSSPLYFSIIFDPVGIIFSQIVLFISANVLIFSSTYILQDKTLPRFTLLVLLFVLSINILIYFPNIIILLLGWDGLGLISFILVIYYQNPKSLAAGIFTAITNRVGDVFLLISIGWIINQGHWNILTIFFSGSRHNKFIIIFIIIAAITKRAQIPFRSWLPAAIAAPTPVSALVHSSTLVTAGVFLLTRFYPFLTSFKIFHTSLTLIATLTILIAGIRALGESDLKKIIALSTLSQLGIIIGSLGLIIPSLTIFHLLTHALFKALLFITAGTLIHYFSHTQNIRKMGIVPNQLPIITTSLITANLALCGSPFLAGFYSKDLIIEIELFNKTNSLILALFLLGTAFTSIYSTRIIIFGLWSPFNQSAPTHNINNINLQLWLPCIILSLGAITRGAILNWFIFQPLIHPTLFFYIKQLPLILTLAGIVLALYFFRPSNSPALSITLPTFYFITVSIWFITPLSTQPIIKPIFTSGKLILNIIDQGWLEILGPSGIKQTILTSTRPLSYIQNNIINVHLLLLLTPIILILLYYLDSLNI